MMYIPYDTENKHGLQAMRVGDMALDSTSLSFGMAFSVNIARLKNA